MNKGYIAPEAALKKLRAAKRLGQTVYIYGATGYGKTELVKQYLSKRRYRHISCAEDAAGLLETAAQGDRKGKEAETRRVVAVDDLHLLKDPGGGVQGCPLPHKTAGRMAHPDLPQPHPGLADAALCGRGIPRHHGG